MDVFALLRDAGLVVEFYEWDLEEITLVSERVRQDRAAGLDRAMPYFFYARVRKPVDHPTYNDPPAYTRTRANDRPPQPLDSFVAQIRVNVENRTACWWSIWETIPGPREHEFKCSHRSLEEAMPGILHYYCGTPTPIGDWVVPFHRHPELVPMKVQSVIARARRTTAAALEAHQAGHSRRRQAQWTLGRRDTWSWDIALRRQYVVIEHRNDPNLHLYLRRDSQAAWIIARDAMA